MCRLWRVLPHCSCFIQVTAQPSKGEKCCRDVDGSLNLLEISLASVYRQSRRAREWQRLSVLSQSESSMKSAQLLPFEQENLFDSQQQIEHSALWQNCLWFFFLLTLKCLIDTYSSKLSFFCCFASPPYYMDKRIGTPVCYAYRSFND